MMDDVISSISRTVKNIPVIKKGQSLEIAEYADDIILVYLLQSLTSFSSTIQHRHEYIHNTVMLP